MRKIYFILSLFTTISLTGQTIDDLYRYSGEFISGTARFQAMGGAFGALGGDVSASQINPAASAVMTQGQFAITASIFNDKTIADFGGEQNKSNRGNIDMTQAGGAIVYESDQSNWNKIAFGLSYDLSKQFNQSVYAEGSTTQGMDQFFLYFAQGIPLNDLSLFENEYIEEAYERIGIEQGYGNQQAFLGLYGGLIEADDNNPSTSSYFSNADYDNLNQVFELESRGRIGKYALNASAAYQDFLYLGASVNFYDLFYERFNYITENGFSANSTIQNASFDNYLFTRGNGINVSLGGILRLKDLFRLGLSYQTPTIYQLTDETSQQINSNYAFEDVRYIDYSIINLFEDYKIKTPSIFTASTAFVIGQTLLISADYSTTDYATAEFKDKRGIFDNENSQVASIFQKSNTLRIGSELKLNPISIRFGIQRQSATQKNSNLGEMKVNSFGIGYTYGLSRIDFALVGSSRQEQQYFFDTVLNNSASTKINNVSAVFTYTLNL